MKPTAYTCDSEHVDADLNELGRFLLIGWLAKGHHHAWDVQAKEIYMSPAYNVQNVAILVSDNRIGHSAST